MFARLRKPSMPAMKGAGVAQTKDPTGAKAPRKGSVPVRKKAVSGAAKPKAGQTGAPSAKSRSRTSSASPETDKAGTKPSSGYKSLPPLPKSSGKVMSIKDTLALRKTHGVAAHAKLAGKNIQSPKSNPSKSSKSK